MSFGLLMVEVIILPVASSFRFLRVYAVFVNLDLYLFPSFSKVRVADLLLDTVFMAFPGSCSPISDFKAFIKDVLHTPWSPENSVILSNFPETRVYARHP